MKTQPTLRQRFNMVEVVIALVIVLVALVGLMALIPRSVESSQDAVGRTNAADAGEQVLRYFGSRLQADWAEEAAIPTAKWDAGDDRELAYSQGSLIEQARIRIQYETPNELLEWNPTVHNTGLFKLSQQTATNQTDFDGVVRLWKQVSPEDAGPDDPKSVKLFAEVSWPAHAPYEQRRKEVYDYELFRQAAAAYAMAEAPAEEDEDLFTISGGEVILNVPCEAEVRVLGCAISYGGSYDMKVTAKVSAAGTWAEPFGAYNLAVTGNVNDGSQHVHDAGVLNPDDRIKVTAKSWMKKSSSYSGTSDSHWKVYMEKASSPVTPNVKVLRDGDPVPCIQGYLNQADAEAYLAGYFDPATQKITLQPNQAIYLFELGTTNMSSPSADFQDCVVLVTLSALAD